MTSEIAAFQVAIVSAALNVPDREVSVGRPDHIKLSGAGGDVVNSRRAKRGDDLRRLGPVDDTHALVTGLEAGAEERQQDLVALLSSGVETTHVLARLKQEALEANIHTRIHEEPYLPGSHEV